MNRVPGNRPTVAIRAGELGLDRHGLRAKLAELGVEHVTADEHRL